MKQIGFPLMLFFADGNCDTIFATICMLFICFLQIPYIETSAKDPPQNVDKAFQDVVRIIRYLMFFAAEQNLSSRTKQICKPVASVSLSNPNPVQNRFFFAAL